MQFQNVLYFLLLAGVFFAMMRFGCGAHVMGHSHSRARSGGDDDAPLAGGQFGAPVRATDPVCGKSVDPAAARSAVYQGHAYYFDSQECREKFEAAPASYVKAATAASQMREHHHGC